MMIGAFGLKVYHPKTGKPVDLTHDNYEEVGKPQLLLSTEFLEWVLLGTKVRH